MNVNGWLQIWFKKQKQCLIDTIQFKGKRLNYIFTDLVKYIKMPPFLTLSQFGSFGDFRSGCVVCPQFILCALHCISACVADVLKFCSRAQGQRPTWNSNRQPTNYKPAALAALPHGCCCRAPWSKRETSVSTRPHRRTPAYYNTADITLTGVQRITLFFLLWLENVALISLAHTLDCLPLGWLTWLTTLNGF